MAKLPVLTAKQIITLLKRRGFELDHATGSHYVLWHPESKRRVTVPFHRKDLPKGTLHSILKQAGLSPDEL